MKCAAQLKYIDTPTRHITRNIYRYIYLYVCAVQSDYYMKQNKPKSQSTMKLEIEFLWCSRQTFQMTINFMFVQYRLLQLIAISQLVPFFVFVHEQKNLIGDRFGYQLLYQSSFISNYLLQCQLSGRKRKESSPLIMLISRAVSVTTDWNIPIKCQFSNILTMQTVPPCTYNSTHCNKTDQLF